MPTQKKSGVRQKLLAWFRRLRFVFWTLVCVTLFVPGYLSLVGLPGFLKRPLLEKLRTRGIELQFKNLRLSFSRGAVAYDVKFGKADEPFAPKFSARRVEMPLNAVALRHFGFEIGGLRLFDGKLVCPLAGTNLPPREVTVENIQAKLRFRADDEWEIENLQAHLGGANIFLSGALAHGSAIRDWKFLHPAQPAAPGKWQEHLRAAADELEQLKFSKPPGLRLTVYGDARDLPGLQIAASFAAPETQTSLGTFRRTRLIARNFGFAGSDKEAAKLTFVRLQTGFEDGTLDAFATLNTATRELRFSANSDFDPLKIRPLLTVKSDHWLSQFSWDKPPAIRANGSVILPEWTNRHPDWRGEVAPTLRLDGEFGVSSGAFRGVPAFAAWSHITYSNMIWHLPDMIVTRPEGELRVEHWTDSRTRDYYWHVRGALDVKCARPLLETNQQHALDLVEFSAPPRFDAEIRGRWLDRARTGVKALVELTNFSFRGETASHMETELEYTNLWLRLIEPRVERGEQRGSLSTLDMDFRTRMLYLTNGLSTLDPMAVARAIGTKTTHALEPYQFLSPPTVQIEGSVSTETSTIADLRIHADGGPFRWWKFNVQHIAGDIMWANQSVVLSDVRGDFYDGQLNGSAGFDFAPREGADFRFNLETTNANLKLLMADVSHGTNLEGRVSGRPVVTSANTTDWTSWQGEGRAMLQDGLLWEIPIIGIFSPVLDAFWPGLGSGRASRGAADFTITNSVIRSENLVLNSPTLRMQYRGAVDFQGGVDACVEAALLRNTWVVGPLVSTLFWPVSKLFEYKVTGQLGHPQTEPVHTVSKILLMPLHPIRTFKSWFSEPPETNASPLAVEAPKLNPQ